MNRILVYLRERPRHEAIIKQAQAFAEDVQQRTGEFVTVVVPSADQIDADGFSVWFFPAIEDPEHIRDLAAGHAQIRETLLAFAERFTQAAEALQD